MNNLERARKSLHMDADTFAVASIFSGITLIVKDIITNTEGAFEPVDPAYLQQKLESGQHGLINPEVELVKSMQPFINQRAFDQIIDMSRQCVGVDAQEQAPIGLTFSGVPIYKKDGSFSHFIPLSVDCRSIGVRTNSSRQAETVIANGLVQQLSNISSGVVKNTLTGPNTVINDPHFSENGVEGFFPYYVAEAHGVAFSNDKIWKTGVRLVSDSTFAHHVAQELSNPETGFCGFIPADEVGHRIGAQESTYQLTQDGQIWNLTFCRNDVTPGLIGPSLINFTRFSSNLRAQVADLFDSVDNINPATAAAGLELVPGNDGMIEVIQHDGTHVVLYRDETHIDPGVASYIIGYPKKLENIDTAPRSGTLSLESVPGFAMIVIGLVTLARHYRPRRSVEKPKVQPKRKRPRYRPPADLVVQQRVVEPPAEKPPAAPEPEAPPVFTLFMNGEEAQLTSVNEISLDQAIPKSEETIKDRVRNSKKEILTFIQTALKVERGDFKAVQAELMSRIARFSKIHVGGDSVTVAYAIQDTRRNATLKELGYLIIDINVDEQQVSLSYSETKPTTQAAIEIERRNIAEATMLTIEDNAPPESVEAVASKITPKILQLISAHDLSAESFTNARAYCRQLMEKYSTNSLVKRAVIAQLSKYLKESSDEFVLVPEKYELVWRDYTRSISSRLYDYVAHYTLTSHDDYDAFTGTALDLLEQQGLLVFPETASKSWATRSDFRTQIIKVEDENGNQRIAAIFTHHDH